MNWIKDDWRKVIFFFELIDILSIKTKKSRRLKKEKLLPECLQQTNAGDGRKMGISSFGTTTAKVYTENTNGQLYCDVLETELKRSMAKFPKKTKMVYQQDLAPWDTSNIVKDKIAKLKVNVLNWAPKKSCLEPDRDIVDKKTDFKTNLFENGSDGKT